MATEKILGYNTLSDTNEIVPGGTFNYAYGKVYTAGWSGGASSVTCTTGKIRVSEWDSGTYNFKIVVWDDSSGEVIAVSDAVSGASPGWGEWETWTVTFSPGVTITKGTSYRLGFVFSSSVYARIMADGSGTAVSIDLTNSYSSPQTFGVGDNTGDADLGVWLEADTAGGTSAVLKYKTAATAEGIAAESWVEVDWDEPFESDGHVKLRVEAP